VAVCPTGAITHSLLPADDFVELPAEAPVTMPALLDLLRRRRSIRRYRDEPVPDEVIRQLIDAAVLAPSGHNAQSWHFTVIRDAQRLQKIRDCVIGFYEKLLKMLDSPLKRPVLRLIAGRRGFQALRGARGPLSMLIRDHHRGQDRILWGAPALILAHAPKADLTGAESCHYAVANMMLAATSMGLGTCLIGFLTIPAQRHRPLRDELRVPPDHELHAALVVGYPDLEFVRNVPRRKPPVEML